MTIVSDPVNVAVPGSGIWGMVGGVSSICSAATSVGISGAGGIGGGGTGIAPDGAISSAGGSWCTDGKSRTSGSSGRSSVCIRFGIGESGGRMLFTVSAGLSCFHPLSWANRKNARIADKRRFMVAAGVCAETNQCLYCSIDSVLITRSASLGEFKLLVETVLSAVFASQEKNALRSLL